MAKKDETARICHHCHRIDFSGKDVCPLCGGAFTEEPLVRDELKEFSREAHNRNIAGYDKAQNAGCRLVIGGIVFLIGVLFIFLSLEKKKNKIVGINVASFQFFVCVAALAIGTVLLSIGAVNLIIAQTRRREARKEIDYLTELDHVLPKP